MACGFGGLRVFSFVGCLWVRCYLWGISFFRVQFGEGDERVLAEMENALRADFRNNR